MIGAILLSLFLIGAPFLIPTANASNCGLVACINPCPSLLNITGCQHVNSTIPHCNNNNTIYSFSGMRSFQPTGILATCHVPSPTPKAEPCCASSGNDVRCDAFNTCYNIGFNDGRNTTTTADACPAGSFTGPILVNNNTTRIDNQTQAYAYCTGFSDGSTAH